jgi:hypothetical protein
LVKVVVAVVAPGVSVIVASGTASVKGVPPAEKVMLAPVRLMVIGELLLAPGKLKTLLNQMYCPAAMGVELKFDTIELFGPQAWATINGPAVAV